MKFKISGNTINISTVYDDYETFMNETKDPIYHTILNAFKELKEKDKVTVNVKAHVEGVEFESNLEFAKENAAILVDIIKPHFENKEEYETCAEVLKVYSELIG